MPVVGTNAGIRRGAGLVRRPRAVRHCGQGGRPAPLPHAGVSWRFYAVQHAREVPVRQGGYQAVSDYSEHIVPFGEDVAEARRIAHGAWGVTSQGYPSRRARLENVYLGVILELPDSLSSVLFHQEVTVRMPPARIGITTRRTLNASHNSDDPTTSVRESPRAVGTVIPLVGGRERHTLHRRRRLRVLIKVVLDDVRRLRSSRPPSAVPAPRQ